MFKKTLMPVLLLLLLLAAQNLAALDFSADFTITDEKGKATTGKMFMKDSKIRQEMVAEGQAVTTILRIDLQKAWTIMEGNQYMEMDLQTGDPTQPAGAEEDWTMKVIGHETVSGYDCEIREYTYKDKKQGIMVQWFATAINMPVKIVTKKSNGKVTSTTLYSNIKLVKQPDSLFELPEGAEPFGLFGGGKLKLF
jgi:outer membrane lipoprotein-sorting protein